MPARMPEPVPITDPEAFVREYAEAQTDVRVRREVLDRVGPSFGWMRAALQRELDVAVEHLRQLEARARAEVERRRRAA